MYISFYEELFSVVNVFKKYTVKKKIQYVHAFRLMVKFLKLIPKANLPKVKKFRCLSLHST